eukprot:9420303-Pyramimonas_sp.AAC.2
MRGACAESQSWDNSPPKHGQLLVPLLTNSSGPASGETCSAHRSSGRRAYHMSCSHAIALQTCPANTSL